MLRYTFLARGPAASEIITAARLEIIQIFQRDSVTPRNHSPPEFQSCDFCAAQRIAAPALSFARLLVEASSDMRRAHEGS
jgi:hypothetical protein